MFDTVMNATAAGVARHTRRASFGVALCCGTALLAGGSTAVFAADADQPGDATSLEEVVISGTRIQRNGYDAPTPVTVVTAEDISRDAPTNLADFVNKLPEFSNSSMASSSGTSVSDGNGGANYLNLRALGANRTLVLFDGVRLAPSSISGFYGSGGAIDINELPDALISRIDVVTGGASAVYGSDALSGVVNFVLDKDFTGLKATVQGGATTYGDDGQYLFSLTGGTGFDDNRGHFLFSGSYNHVDGIPDAGVRSWAAENWLRVGNPNYTSTNGQPFYLIEPHGGTSYYSPGGLIYGGPLGGTDFGPGGVPRQFNFGSPNDGYNMSGGDWKETAAGVFNQFGPGTSLDVELSRANLFSRASYDITDDVQGYVQVNYARTESYGNCCYTTGDYINITQQNPFLPASLLTKMQSLGLSSFALNTLNTGLGISGTHNIRQSDTFLAGATGKFHFLESSFTWDAYLTRSLSQLEARTVNNLNLQNFALATDAVTDPATGAAICRSTLTDPTNGCVPYNPMGVGVQSQAAMNYVSGNAWLDQTITQDLASVSVRGDPASDWAGPISLALGFEHRKDSVTGTTDALDEENAFWVGNYHPTVGSYNVNEGFLETVIPLAKDLPFAKALDLNGAVRETDYSTSGAVTTWKVGLTYAPIQDVHFRATRSRDIRAPNLGELFQGGQSEILGVNDPFKNNTEVHSNTVTLGNTSLQPEVADTTGAGVVFQPTWLPGFNASFDYYKIDIKDSISELTAQDELNECYTGTQAYCDFINRDANGNITTIYVKPANTAYARTRGFDIEASYSRRLSDIIHSLPGTISVRALGTHVIDLTTVTPDGLATQGVGAMDGSLSVPIAPHWRYNMTVAYDTAGFSAAWTGRGVSAGVHDTQWIQCSSNCPPSVAPYYTIDDNHMPGAFYMDLSLTYHLRNDSSLQSDLFLTVENLANNNPAGVTFINYSPGVYDVLGRVFRAGIRVKL